jgi:hypothetical protein
MIPRSATLLCSTVPRRNLEGGHSSAEVSPRPRAESRRARNLDYRGRGRALCKAPYGGLSFGSTCKIAAYSITDLLSSTEARSSSTVGTEPYTSTLGT